MAETLGGLGIKSIIRAGKGSLTLDDVVIRRTNGNDMFPGCLVSENGETFPDIDLAAAAEIQLLGVILGEEYPADTWDIDDTIADNTKVKVLLPTGRCTIAVLYETVAVNVDYGEHVGTATADAGFWGKFVYGDGAVATDSLAGFMGKAVSTVTGHASNQKVMLVKY